MSYRMNIAATELMSKMSELRQNRAGADVALNCEGKTILAHSLILAMRYFRFMVHDAMQCQI